MACIPIWVLFHWNIAVLSWVPVYLLAFRPKAWPSSFNLTVDCAYAQSPQSILQGVCITGSVGGGRRRRRKRSRRRERGFQSAFKHEGSHCAQCLSCDGECMHVIAIDVVVFSRSDVATTAVVYKPA